MKALQIGNLKVEVPIVQGGMGVAVSLSGLASAVANQGGIGVISSVGIGLHYGTGKYTRANDREGFRHEIRKARQLSPNGVIGANIMLAVSDFDNFFKLALEEKLDIVFVGAGLFIKKPETVTTEEFINSKTKLVPKISSARAAQLTFKVWDEKFHRLPDAVVIEGAKAGGHLGFKKQELLDGPKSIYQIIKETREILLPFQDKYGFEIPIIAGGGIYTGKDIQKAFLSGANGVKMGTRFVTTHECDADINFKMQYINATKPEDVVIIDSPVGLPGRAIDNDFLRGVAKGNKKPVSCPFKCLKTCNYKEVPYCIAEALYNASIGDFENGFAFAGSNGYRATEIISVEETFNQIKAEYLEAKFNAKRAEIDAILV
ncbi:MAG: nitronate monooxygenase [Bacteroidales bacterium]|nr:nitronate monooxygenase [Bacteroidales bacterium]